MSEPIRFVTFLSPSLPLALFESVARAVGAAVRRPVVVRAETRWSGPSGPEDDPLGRGDADVAFLCPPAYLWLARGPEARVTLVPAAPVFRDPRAKGRPVYFSDVVVPAASRARRLSDLRGGTFAYNDGASLSGFHSVLDALGAMGERPDFFRRLLWSGSHLASLDLVAVGRADGAAIDSNALALALERDPALAARLRVVDGLGPFPAQPVVARAGLPADLRAAIAGALLGIGEDPVARESVAAFGLAGFAPVAEADYRDHPALRGSEGRRPEKKAGTPRWGPGPWIGAR